MAPSCANKKAEKSISIVYLVIVMVVVLVV
jgi:hypothetical protein